MSGFSRTTRAFAFYCACLCAAPNAAAFAMGHGVSGGRTSAHAGMHGFASGSGAHFGMSAQPAGRASVIVTRPAPPFRRRFVCPPRVIVVEPFFSHRTFIGGNGLLLFSPGPPVAVIDAPFFCWLDGLGFIDRDSFVRHLHNAHGMPLANVLSFCELVGGRVVFFGF